MLIDWGWPEYKTPDYKKYKSDKFEKTRNKVKMLLNGINDSSLKKEDKTKLLQEIKQIVSKFTL